MGSAARRRGRYEVRNKGNKHKWTIDVADVRAAFADLIAACDDAVAEVTTAALAHMAARLGRFVLDTAEERREIGRLEFHDLLVRRRLLRSPEHGVAVRHSLGTAVSPPVARRVPGHRPDPDRTRGPDRADPTIDITGKAWHEIETRPGSLFLVGDPKQSIYRFRRADIGTFLTAREHISDRPALTVNFRTTKPIIEWINDIFGALIVAEPGSQAEYVALSAHRQESAPVGPAVAVLGADTHAEKLSADELRPSRVVTSPPPCRSCSMALAVVRRRWRRGWRPAIASDVCILLPSRTSCRRSRRHSPQWACRTALRPHRSSTHRARSVRSCSPWPPSPTRPTNSPPSPRSARSSTAVATMTSPTGASACGPVHLEHRSPRSRVPSGRPRPAASPAAHEARLWSTPAELLDRLIRERGVLETAIAGGNPRDVWRRLRFVIDQARAWVDAGGVDLRAYLRWARLQGPTMPGCRKRCCRRPTTTVCGS